MKKILFLVLLSSSVSFAALPPQHEQARRLKFVIDQAASNGEVVKAIEDIGFNKYEITSRAGNCKTTVALVVGKLPDGMLGPNPLEGIRILNTECKSLY